MWRIVKESNTANHPSTLPSRVFLRGSLHLLSESEEASRLKYGCFYVFAILTTSERLQGLRSLVRENFRYSSDPLLEHGICRVQPMAGALSSRAESRNVRGAVLALHRHSHCSGIRLDNLE